MLLRVAISEAETFAPHLGFKHFHFLIVKFRRVVALRIAKQVILVSREVVQLAHPHFLHGGYIYKELDIAS